MAITLKSKQGCWTCRLRRKKCDEKHPSCSTCESLLITCYGYNTKPEWMDGGEREKAMAHNIKQIVKKTSRHKGRLGISLSRLQGRSAPQTDNGRDIKIAPKRVDAQSSSALDVAKELTPPTLDNASSATPNDGNNGGSPDSTGADPLPLSWLSAIKSDEAVLLMHFLDTVFPLQYPMYRPSVHEGGRGWLLSLLLKTKPLYHASLALSAYHRGTVLLAASLHGCSTASTVNQRQHLAVCLSEFRQAIIKAGNWVNGCSHQSLGLMACVLQLIFFELFAGHGDTWRIHLQASTGTFSKMYWDQAMKLGLVDSPDALFDGEKTLVIDEGRSSPEEAGIFLFLSGVIIWLDVLSSITTGKSPCLLSYHLHAVSCTSAIKLENIMGCQNWTMFQIGQISSLHDFKCQALEGDCLDAAEFDRRANAIRHALDLGLAEYTLSTIELSSQTNVAITTVSNPEIYLVTRLFTLAASIYLDLVVQGYELEAQEPRSVAEALLIFQTKVPSHLMQVIVYPLFIVGSVAIGDKRDFFRQVFNSAPILDPSLEHRGKILPTLEEIWRMRHATVVWTWQDTLKLSGPSLLLV